MNAFTKHIVNEEERQRIDGQSHIDVYVPKVDSSQYVISYSGDYWVNRIVSITDVLEDEKSVKRTLNRTTNLAIVDDRPPGSNFPGELRDVGQRIGADLICPITHTGVSRDAIYAPVDRFRYHDNSSGTDFVVPVPHPHPASIPAINQGLFNENDVGGAGINGVEHPRHFMLCDLQKHGFEWDTIQESIELLHDQTSGDARIHLYQPQLTGDMVRYIRANPGTIESIILPDDASSLLPTSTEEDSSTDITELFSKSGNRALRSDMCPFVRVAAEFTLLCSPFIEPENQRELHALIEESIIPTGTPSIDQVKQTDTDQGTLTSLIS